MGFNEEGGGLSLPLPRSLAASKPQIPGGTGCGRRSYACNATTRQYHYAKKTAAGHGVRALNPRSRDDIQLFKAVVAGYRRIRGLSNSDTRTSLEEFPHLRDLGLNRKKQSAKVSRILNRFHAHNLIAKIPRGRRWRVTDRGREIMAASLCSGILHFLNSFARMLLLEFSCRKTKKSRIKNLSTQAMTAGRAGRPRSSLLYCARSARRWILCIMRPCSRCSPRSSNSRLQTLRRRP